MSNEWDDEPSEDGSVFIVEEVNEYGVSYKRSGSFLHGANELVYAIERQSPHGWERLLEWPIVGGVYAGFTRSITWDESEIDWNAEAEAVTTMARTAKAALAAAEAAYDLGGKSEPWPLDIAEYEGLECVVEVGGVRGSIAELANTILTADATADMDDVSAAVQHACAWLALVKTDADLQHIEELVSNGHTVANVGRLNERRAETQ